MNDASSWFPYLLLFSSSASLRIRLISIAACLLVLNSNILCLSFLLSLFTNVINSTLSLLLSKCVCQCFSLPLISIYMPCVCVCVFYFFVFFSSFFSFFFAQHVFFFVCVLYFHIILEIVLSATLIAARLVHSLASSWSVVGFRNERGRARAGVLMMVMMLLLVGDW